MKTLFRWKLGSVQSKAISLLTLASIILPLLAPVSAYATDLPPSVPNSNVFTASTEAPKVDGPTGAFTQRIPLDIPPGRNGLQPDVSLQYNSQNTEDGIVGYGWSVSVPYIQRLNKTGSQDLYGNAPYFTSSVDGEIVSDSTTTPLNAVPSILDTVPFTFASAPNFTDTGNVTSYSANYTVPAGGSNKCLVGIVGSQQVITSMSLHGASTTATVIPGTLDRLNYYYAVYLENPITGTFTFTQAASGYVVFEIMTVQNCAVSSPIDAASVKNVNPASSITNSATTTVANDLLIGWGQSSNGGCTIAFSSHGTGQTAIGNDKNNANLCASTASFSTTTSSLTENWSTSGDLDQVVMAVKPVSLVVTATSTLYRAKVDDGSFNSYSFTNNTWVVYDKKGTKYTYGSDDAGRMYDTGTGTSTKTYKWMLQEVRDTNDNYVKYTYNRDSNTLYPYKITYTGRGSTDGISTVTFATSTRADTRVRYDSGFVATSTKLISQITAAVNGTTVRQYDLTYVTGNNGYRSLLRSLQQKGYDENNNLTQLPAMVFNYASSSQQFYAPGAQSILNAAYVVADVEGDGINDTTYMVDSNGAVFSDNAANPTNFTAPVSWAAPPVVPSELGARFVDVNGDGKADAIKGLTTSNPFTASSTLYINTYSLSTGYGWSASTTYTGSMPVFAVNGPGTSQTTGIFGNLNGDNLPDYIANSTGQVGAYLGNGSAWDGTTTIFAAAQDFSTSEAASQLIDVNGDGLDDWVYSSGGYMYTLLNNGTGWNSGASPQWSIATSTLYHNSSYYDRGIRFMDLNGDGLPDFVRSYSGGSTCTAEKATVKAVYINTGNGWATSTAYTLPAYVTSCTSSTFTNNEYANFNGNGQMAKTSSLA